MQIAERYRANLMQLYPVPALMLAKADLLAAARSDDPVAMQMAGFMQWVARSMRAEGIGSGL